MMEVFGFVMRRECAGRNGDVVRPPDYQSMLIFCVSIYCKYSTTFIYSKYLLCIIILLNKIILYFITNIIFLSKQL